MSKGRKMSDIPTDAYREVLRRVPVDSLFQLRSVCKSWRDIIDDPQFIKLHMHHGTGNDWIILYHEFKGTSNLFLLPVEHLLNPKTSLSAEYWVHPTNIKAPQITPGVARIGDGLFYPTCNGLILVTNPRKTFVWTIWNPFTGQVFKLPLLDKCPSAKSSDEYITCGLGHVEATNDYKVVRIVGSHTFICSVNLGAWRRIQDLLNDCQIRYGRGVFAYGALHWRGCSVQNSNVKCIVSLDLNKGTYRKIPSPENGYQPIGLTEMGGCLFSFRERMWNEFVLWKIDDYNGSDDDKMWIPMITLRSETITRITPVAYVKSKNWILLKYSSHLAWYDLGKQCLSKLSIQLNPDEHKEHPSHSNYVNALHGSEFLFGYLSFQVIPASLVRLKSDETSSKRKRKRAVKKFGLKVSIDAPADVLV